MKIIKLTEICNPKQWKTLSTEQLLSSGYSVYGANGKIGYFNDYNHENPTVMITCRGATCGAINLSEPKSWINGNAMCLDDLSENVNLRYLVHYLSNYDFRNVISGSAQPQITRENLNKVTIKLYDPKKQEEIANNLDKIKKIIEQHKSLLLKYDTLIKSRFIEMFGDPVSNPRGWKIKTLNEICRKITDGKHGGCQVDDKSDYYFVGAREIFNLDIHYETAQKITKQDFEKDYKRCNLEIGDFCIVNTGATIGKTAIAKDERTTHTLLQKSVALLKVKPEEIIPLYLQYSYITNESMYKVESASAQPNLLLSKIRETKLMVPPIELQNDFADFVQQIDKSKFAVQKSLEKAETLYKSLMQEYFG